MQDVNNYVPISEYAQDHGVSIETVKKKCQTGKLTTAKKMGRNWIVDKSEPWKDGRNKEMRKASITK